MRLRWRFSHVPEGTTTYGMLDARIRRAARPGLEVCEERLVLSTIAVPNEGPPQRRLAMSQGMQPMPFETQILEGPDAGYFLKGVLRLKAVGDGEVRGRLDTGPGPDVPVVGRLGAGRIGLGFNIGDGRVLRTTGAVRGVPLAGGGFNLTGSGTSVIPGTGDHGAWGLNYQAGVHIQFDYSLDTNHFFDDPARRNLLQMAADALTSRMMDTLTAIVSPQAIPGTSFTNTWTAQTTNPSTGGTVSFKDLNVPRDTIIIYAGARDLASPTVGIGTTGAFSASGTQAFLDNIRARGQGTRTSSTTTGALASPPTDLGPWGGSIAFDTVGPKWFFGTTTAGITSAQTDFLSVATHEIGHILGINSGSQFTRYIVSGAFTGPNARAANGGANVPVASGSSGHWASGVKSPPGTGQEVAMSPSLLNGTRKLFTAIDFGGLKDVGWQIS